MNITKQEVSDWLKKFNHTRKWLADKCSVSKRTVDNWLSSPQDIPAKAIPIITALMHADEEKARIETVLPQNLVLEFSREDFNAICDRAIHERMRPNEWAEQQLRQLAYEDLDSLAQELRAAEDPQPYNQPDSPQTFGTRHEDREGKVDGE